MCTPVLIVLICGAMAHATDGLSDQRSLDEIWMVSERHIGYLQSEEIPPLVTKRYDWASGWVDAETTDLSQPASPEQILVVYIHGNRMSSCDADYHGRYVYRLITSQIDDPVSIRYVIWSWPSAEIQGQMRDLRGKARRTELSGYCLGWFLAQLPEQQRVSLLGYSYGARIATGALHLLGGGQLSGRTLPETAAPGPQARVVMFAAALHHNWLRPGGYHEMAWSHLDYMLNLFNSCDPVLKRYRFLYKGSHAQALGFVGMYTGDLGPSRELIEQRNVCNVVRKSHSESGYFRSRRLLQRMQQVLFWNPVGQEPVIAMNKEHPASNAE